jgi:hypothetical protein
MAKTPSRRIFARYPCDLPIEIHSPVTQARLAEARLLDLSMGGGAISCALALQRTIPYEFRFNWGRERLAVTGRVVWTGPLDKKTRMIRYGVSFNVTPAQEALLKSLVDELRTKARPDDEDGKLRDYWKT